MFSRTTKKLPKPVEFSLKPEEFLEDIETIAKCEEERKMLYQCIDSKLPPIDSRLHKIEDFLRDNDELEHIVKDLHTQSKEFKEERKELEGHKQDITNLLSNK